MKKYIEEIVLIKRPPTIASFTTLQEAISDSFLPAKLEFFKFVAQKLEPFLKKYQTDKPMIPFLYADLFVLIRSVAKTIVKKQVFDAATSTAKLLKISLEPDSSDLRSSKDTVLGTATSALLAKIPLSDLTVRHFREACRNFLIATLRKILERSPIRIEMIRAVSSLSPAEITTSAQTACRRFDVCVQTLYACNRITSTVADQAREQFGEIVESARFAERFKSFDVTSDRVDEFWFKLLSENGPFVALTKCIKVSFVVINIPAREWCSFTLRLYTFL